MAASLLGTTGNLGFPEDEFGIRITDLSFDFSNQERTECALLNRERLVDKVKQDVPLARVKRRGKIALLLLNASPRTENLYLGNL